LRDKIAHEAVMVNQVINSLIVDKKGIYLDSTFGLGGHSSAILNNLDNEATLFGLDRDPECQKFADEIKELDKRFLFINDRFSNLQTHFLKESLDGVLVDLGISSKQLDDPERGFTFQSNGPLDMRMNQSEEFSATEWIKRASKEEISNVLWELGEERKSRKIANLICKERDLKPINTTKQLSEIILLAKPRNSRRHPATNAFRAIRMEINSELQELQDLLIAAGNLLKEGGRLVVISFHSLEDRIVKRFLQGKSEESKSYSFKRIGSKFLKPNEEEIQVNPRSRSAILRVGEKMA
tara:strand:+ start:706 stop:1593 length:888 start_codon:yes stop_codon:yes gene_type:complete